MPTVGRCLFYLWGEILLLLFSRGVTEDGILCHYKLLQTPATSSSATPTVALTADQPTSFSWRLALRLPALPAPYPQTHTSCTTSTRRL